MPLTEALDQLKNLLPTAQSVMLLLGPDPSYDQVAAALALQSALLAAGKDVILASPVELPSATSTLSGSSQVQQKLGNQNLSIKFPYQAESVDKVSYHISDDNKTFYLVIKPQKGHKPLNFEALSFDYTGADTDLIVLLGVHQFEVLEHLYLGYEELYERVPVVSIHTFETAIGSVKIDTSKYSSYSQAMVHVLKELQLPVSADAATNLLAGIELVTNGFASSIATADTFEVVADLLRQGGRRLKPQLSVDKVSSIKSTRTTVLSESNQTTGPKKKKLKTPVEVTGDGDADVGGLGFQSGAEGSFGRG